MHDSTWQPSSLVLHHTTLGIGRPQLKTLRLPGWACHVP